MNLNFASKIIAVLGMLVGSSAFSASVCTGGVYRVETSGYSVSLYTNNSLSYQGVPQVTKVLDGHNYLDVSPNVGPKPQDVIIENSFVVPMYATGSVYYSYLDTRVSQLFPVPSSSVSRTPLICQGW